MYIIVGVFVRLRTGNHYDLSVIRIQIQHDRVQLPHGVADLAGNYFHGNGVVFAGSEVHIHVLAVVVLDGGHAEIGVIVKFHLIEFLAGNLAVNVDAAVGVKSTHFLLPCLDAQLVPAVAGEGACIYLPCNGLECLFPVAAADGVIQHVLRVRRGNGTGGIVIGRIQHGIRFQHGVFALDANHTRGRTVLGNGRIDAADIGVIIGNFFRLCKANGFQCKIRLFGRKGDLVRALFQIEEHRLIEQPVGIAQPCGLPQFDLFLCRTYLIAHVIGLDLSLVLVDLVQFQTGSGVIGHLAVNCQRNGDLRGIGNDGTIGHLHGIDAGFRHVQLVAEAALRVVPDQGIVPRFSVFVSIAACFIAFAVCLLKIRTGNGDLRRRTGLLRILVVVIAVGFLLLIGEVAAGIRYRLLRRCRCGLHRVGLCRKCRRRRKCRRCHQTSQYCGGCTFVPFVIRQGCSTLLSVRRGFWGTDVFFRQHHTLHIMPP